ncbi:MAG: PAS domain S-box protein [Candidatus Marinimicrobia bacterium]|nr:PAS domain S-box protein [Candidatus Neomarinimicrobiota bacterium]
MDQSYTFANGDTASIIHNLNTAVFRTTLGNKGQFIDVNPAFLKVFGYSNKTELESIAVVDIYAKAADRDKMRDELRSKGYLREKEFQLKKKNAEIFTGRVSSVLVKDEAGVDLYIDGVVEDVSDQKIQAAALKAAEAESQRLTDAAVQADLSHLKDQQSALLKERNVFFSGPVVLIQWPLSETAPLIHITKNVKELLGYQASEFLEGKIHYPDLVHDDDRFELQAHIRLVLGEGGDVIFVHPYRLRKKDGQYIWVQDYGQVQKNSSGEVIGILGYIYDITEVQESQKKIADSEYRYRSLVENSPTGILRIDCEGNIVEVNKRMVEFLGSPSKEATQSFNMFTFPPLVAAGISGKFHESIDENKKVTFASEYKSKWGKTVHFQVVIMPVIDTGGELIGAQANMEDVSLRRLAEAAKKELEESQLEERNIFMAGPVMIVKWAVSAEDPVLQISENVQSILGYSMDEFLSGGILFSNIIHPEDVKRARNSAKNAINLGLDLFDSAPYRIRHKQGHYLWVNDHSTVNRDKDGVPKSITGIVWDISNMIKAEEALKLTEQTYQELFNAITEAIFIHDHDTFEILDVNETVLDMYGYARDEILGMDVQLLSNQLVDYSDGKSLMHRVKTEGAQTVEMEAKHKDGSKFWVEVKFRDATIHGEKRILANVRDISSRKQYLQELEKSAQEQEILLREVHHRVKNNMQVIISLLNLQAEYAQDTDLFEIFREMQNRIRSMALIHEKLFRSKSMSSVDFANYINSLTFELINFYSIDSERIRIHQNVDEMKLNITKAIPCGLIVNELITNSLKYAFPENREGDIWLSVRAIDSKSAEIEIKDNGIGLAKIPDFATTRTMGLRIVRILTEQLGGQMTIGGDQGVCFTLRFNLKDD